MQVYNTDCIEVKTELMVGKGIKDWIPKAVDGVAIAHDIGQANWNDLIYVD